MSTDTTSHGAINVKQTACIVVGAIVTFFGTLILGCMFAPTFPLAH